MSTIDKETGPSDHANNKRETASAEAALKARLSRKRTKTGCLTCRKRRIKCGEERPMCKNCVKSRRSCEGYIQRVVFKPTTFDYRLPPGGGTPMTFNGGLEPVASVSYQPPAPFAYERSIYPLDYPAAISPNTHPSPVEYVHHPYHNHAPNDGQASTPIQYSIAEPGHAQWQHHHHYDPAYLYSVSQQQPSVPLRAQTIPSGAPVAFPLAPQYVVAPTRQQIAEPHLTQQHNLALQSTWNATISASIPTNPISVPLSTTAPATDAAAFPEHPTTWQESSLSPLTHIDNGQSRSITMRTRQSPSAHSESRSLDFAYPDDVYHSSLLVTDVGPTQLLRNAAIEVQDDDYFDVEPDDDTALSNQPHVPDTTMTTLVQRLNTSQAMHLRSYDTFLSHDMLDTYRPERVASILRNGATARVFLHFISATGPSISPFERRTADTGMLFSASDVPLSQRGLWTYTMPVAALHNQGLLHAMLALASLHIARLQGGSVTPSLQHYAWSLKRIHSAVADRKKRLRTTTIAASMLLGFYEIMTAEHSKWNTHLAGAKQLILETDFSGMLQQFKAMKMDRQLRKQHEASALTMPPSPHNSEDDVLDQIPDVDETIISHFYGREIRYGGGPTKLASWNHTPRLDLHNFEVLKDLFWWYCKQDAYQSVISGNPLLMDYRQWSACPPRAPLGRPDAVYGSFDHLTLILGRVADFASRDRTRKLKVMEQNGGQWRPHPASKMASAPPPPPPPPHSASDSGPQPPGPTFYGMTPLPRSKVQMPASYKSLDGECSPVSAKETWDLETALEEYHKIQMALTDFKTRLGPAFAPLPEDCHSPLPTSFGPALFYRSHDIGCMMAVYNMTAIIAIRSHPYYHPAAHVAAAMAASETAPYANEVGRICAGIMPGPIHIALNPFLGAALVESCMPSFFAAIQYQHPEQRFETVTRIFNIARRTGWGTADLIANGCETAWVKAAAAGRGPPYTRIGRSQVISSTDSRLNGSWEHQDPSAQPDENDQVDRRFIKEKAVARLHWAIGIMGTENDI